MQTREAGLHGSGDRQPTGREDQDSEFEDIGFRARVGAFDARNKAGITTGWLAPSLYVPDGMVSLFGSIEARTWLKSKLSRVDLIQASG